MTIEENKPTASVGEFIIFVDGDDELLRTIEYARKVAKEVVKDGYPRAYIAQIVEVVDDPK